MKQPIRDSKGYTLVDSLVAIALFVTVVLGALNTMNGFMVSPRTKVLYSALVAAENELVRLRIDIVRTENMVEGDLVIKRVVTAKAGYWEITLTICEADDESRILITVTRLVRFPHEE